MYSPSSSSEDIESEDDNANAAEEKKYIVFENELDKLFKFCQQCGSIIATKTKHLRGSMITIKSILVYTGTQIQGNHSLW